MKACSLAHCNNSWVNMMNGAGRREASVITSCSGSKSGSLAVRAESRQSADEFFHALGGLSKSLDYIGAMNCPAARRYDSSIPRSFVTQTIAAMLAVRASAELVHVPIPFTLQSVKSGGRQLNRVYSK